MYFLRHMKIQLPSKPLPPKFWSLCVLYWRSNFSSPLLFSAKISFILHKLIPGKPGNSKMTLELKSTSKKISYTVFTGIRAPTRIRAHDAKCSGYGAPAYAGGSVRRSPTCISKKLKT